MVVNAKSISLTLVLIQIYENQRMKRGREISPHPLNRREKSENVQVLSVQTAWTCEVGTIKGLSDEMQKEEQKIRSSSRNICIMPGQQIFWLCKLATMSSLIWREMAASVCMSTTILPWWHHLKPQCVQEVGLRSRQEPDKNLFTYFSENQKKRPLTLRCWWLAPLIERTPACHQRANKRSLL